MRKVAILSIMDPINGTGPSPMKTMSAKDAKNAFGRLIDTARAEPVMVEKHGRGVVIVMSVEEYERLSASKSPSAAPVGGSTQASEGIKEARR